MAELKTFKDWFDPYNKEHIHWANQYLTNPLFRWEPIVPLNVVVPNDYGVREHIHNVFSTCWILLNLEGVTERPVTQ